MVSTSPLVSRNEPKIERQQVEVMAVQEMLGEQVPLVLVRVPGGEFLMGSPDDEEGRYETEGPQHRVCVKGFWMGQYPVTQEQWRQVSQYEAVHQDLSEKPSHFTGDLLPVERVSWYEAKEFCDRLSSRSNRNYRLPTEAEWEYACRATTSTAYHFGASITSELANCGFDQEQTTPVGNYGVANLYGLYDMHGNVWEWCQDHVHENYEGAPTDGSAWLEQNEDNNYSHTLRGGSWDDVSGLCRSATRGGSGPVDCNAVTGFRVLLAPR